MHRISLVVLALTMLFVGPAITLAESTTKPVWTSGWDNAAQRPLDYAHSFVKFSQPAPNKLNITYHLQGAEPNTTHAVGLHVFGQVVNFGQFIAYPCGWFLRDNKESYA